jgi:hypothetical protein
MMTVDKIKEQGCLSIHKVLKTVQTTQFSGSTKPNHHKEF